MCGLRAATSLVWALPYASCLEGVVCLAACITSAAGVARRVGLDTIPSLPRNQRRQLRCAPMLFRDLRCAQSFRDGDD
jgi:hypothetical protein